MHRIHSTLLCVGIALCVIVPCVQVSAQSGTLTVLHAFSGSDGAYPWAGLVQAKDGNLYGTTRYQGAMGASSNGTIFRITPAGAFTLLYSFSAFHTSTYTNTDGAYPNGLVQGSDGNLYGTTEGGGANGYGTIFQITTNGVFTRLYAFTGGSDQGAPMCALVQGRDGYFYGTTEGGGGSNYGTVFKISSQGALVTLFTFTNGSDGSYPYSGLVQGSDGHLYGTTNSGGIYGDGTVFKITPQGALTTLHSFTGGGSGTDGGGPYFGPLTQGSDGQFYGTTSLGGANWSGTVFKMTAAGALTTLHAFSALSNGSYGTNLDGSNPSSGIVQASDGNFYGAAGYGGTHGDGTLYKITSGGVFTVLYTFAGADGNTPVGFLLQANDGKLYGTTTAGGIYTDGSVYCFDAGITPTPAIASISPNSRNAGGPAFTLNVKGSNFTTSSVVHWTAGTTNTALTTTYVSATQLKAAVPASLVATPGKASITVATSSSISNSKPFTILLTTLKLASASLTQNSTTGVYTATISLKNVGYLSASNVAITKASLGPASTSATLPISLGTLSAGATTSTALSFPGSAGSSGTVVSIKVTGTFTGGKFNGSLMVTLP